MLHCLSKQIIFGMALEDILSFEVMYVTQQGCERKKTSHASTRVIKLSWQYKWPIKIHALHIHATNLAYTP